MDTSQNINTPKCQQSKRQQAKTSMGVKTSTNQNVNKEKTKWQYSSNDDYQTPLQSQINDSNSIIVLMSILTNLRMK